MSAQVKDPDFFTFNPDEVNFGKPSGDVDQSPVSPGIALTSYQDIRDQYADIFYRSHILKLQSKIFRKTCAFSRNLKKKTLKTINFAFR